MGLGLAAFSAGLAVFCLEENRAQRDYPATTWVAATLTCALGAYAIMGDMRAAVGFNATRHDKASEGALRLAHQHDRCTKTTDHARSVLTGTSSRAFHAA